VKIELLKLCTLFFVAASQKYSFCSHFARIKWKIIFMDGSWKLYVTMLFVMKKCTSVQKFGVIIGKFAKNLAINMVTFVESQANSQR
jgi:hypothetical protein